MFTVSVSNAIKKEKSYPDFCRIEGKTFPMEKLKEFFFKNVSL